MELQELRSLHSTYSNAPGGEQVATWFSFYELYRVLESNSLRKIVELGGGIGTLSELTLHNTQAKLEIFEANQFCLNRLFALQARFSQRVTIHEQYDKAEVVLSEADLIVLDVNRSIFDAARIVPVVGDTVIFVEGHQIQQRWALMKSLLYNRRHFNYQDKRPGPQEKGCLVLTLTSRQGIIGSARSFFKSGEGPKVAFQALAVRVGANLLPLIRRIGMYEVAKFAAKRLGLHSWYESQNGNTTS